MPGAVVWSQGWDARRLSWCISDRRSRPTLPLLAARHLVPRFGQARRFAEGQGCGKAVIPNLLMPPFVLCAGAPAEECLT